MKAILIAIFILVCFSNCATYKRCAQKFGNLKSDTVTITKLDTATIKIAYDTTITAVPGETVILHDSIPCPELINKKFKGKSTNGNTQAEVEIKDNKITVECKADSLMQVIIRKDTEITLLKRELQTITKTTTLVDNRTWLQKLPWYVVLGVLLGIALAVALFIKKIIK